MGIREKKEVGKEDRVYLLFRNSRPHYPSHPLSKAEIEETRPPLRNVYILPTTDSVNTFKDYCWLSLVHTVSKALHSLYPVYFLLYISCSSHTKFFPGTHDFAHAVLSASNVLATSPAYLLSVLDRAQ